MADAKRVVRQWLETDAAFGVEDVPLVRRKRAVAPAGAVAAVASAVQARQAAAQAVEGMRSPPGHQQQQVVRDGGAGLPQRPVAAPPRVATPLRAAAPAQGSGSERAAAPRVAATSSEGAMAKKKPVVVMPATPSGTIASLPAISREEKLAALEKLRAETEAACAPLLCDMCTRMVFGEGDVDAPILFVGEGPGAEEDKTGRPFVGRSGQLLDKMIVAIGFQREQVYIANVVKLRCAEMDEMAGGR